jgi:hypothetical protein
MKYTQGQIAKPSTKAASSAAEVYRCVIREHAGNEEPGMRPKAGREWQGPADHGGVANVNLGGADLLMEQQKAVLEGGEAEADGRGVQ